MNTAPIFGLALFLAAGMRPLPAQTNLLVAQDGSGQFKSVQAAIMSVPAGSAANPVVIRIKPGTYKESIYVQREKRFFRLLGEDAEKTVLTYDFHAGLKGPDGQPLGTFRTPSTTIDADDFVAERTYDGRPFRIRNVLDEYTRECLAIVVKRKLTSLEVIDALAHLFVSRGLPEHIRSDNGPEFTCRAFMAWMQARKQDATPIVYDLTRQGWRFPKQLAFGYAVFHYVP